MVGLLHTLQHSWVLHILSSSGMHDLVYSGSSPVLGKLFVRSIEVRWWVDCGGWDHHITKSTDAAQNRSIEKVWANWCGTVQCFLFFFTKFMSFLHVYGGFLSYKWNGKIALYFDIVNMGEKKLRSDCGRWFLFLFIFVLLLFIFFLFFIVIIIICIYFFLQVQLIQKLHMVLLLWYFPIYCVKVASQCIS